MQPETCYIYIEQDYITMHCSCYGLTDSVQLDITYPALGLRAMKSTTVLRLWSVYVCYGWQNASVALPSWRETWSLNAYFFFFGQILNLVCVCVILKGLVFYQLVWPNYTCFVQLSTVIFLQKIGFIFTSSFVIRCDTDFSSINENLWNLVLNTEWFLGYLGRGIFSLWCSESFLWINAMFDIKMFQTLLITHDRPCFSSGLVTAKIAAVFQEIRYWH